jgi:hypothetical protein
LNRKTPRVARIARDNSRRRAGDPARRYASLGACSSAASVAPNGSFKRFAAGRGLWPLARRGRSKRGGGRRNAEALRVLSRRSAEKARRGVWVDGRRNHGSCACCGV